MSHLASSVLDGLFVLVLFIFVSCNSFAYPLENFLIHVSNLTARDIAGSMAHIPGASIRTQSDGTCSQIRCRLNIKGLSGAKDADHVFEDLDLFLNLNMGKRPDSRKSQWKWALKAAWPKGQVLFFPWFFDLSQLKGSLVSRGSLAEKSGIHVDYLRLYGPFSLEARNLFLPCAKRPGEKDNLSCILTSQWHLKGDIKKLYDLFVKDAFSDTHPIVQRFEPTGRLLVSGRGLSVNLQLEGDLSFGSKDFIKEIVARLSYPLKKGRCEQGSVSWKALFLSPLLPKEVFRAPSKIRLKGRSLPVRLCRNRASLGPVALDLGNGTISLEEAAFFFSRGTLRLKGIDIERLHVHQLLKDVPVSVTIEGSLPEASFQGQRLVFSGSLTVKVARGTMEIRNIWVEPYAPIFRWGADMFFKNINLRVLTENTSFGLVTGAVKGWIKDLVMSGGQPEAFDLRIESDESSKEPKRISIKAIENLSILGGGGGSISFLGQLFKTFSYSKIGISCKLSNDVFELHGLYKRGDREYLIKRGFFGGVNVINMNPRGRISFRDMLDRLKRIGQSGNSKMEVR